MVKYREILRFRADVQRTLYKAFCRELPQKELSGTLPATYITDALTRPIPLIFNVDAPVDNRLMSEVEDDKADTFAAKVSYSSSFCEYAQTPRYQADLCNPRKAKSFSGVVLKMTENEAKPREIKESHQRESKPGATQVVKSRVIAMIPLL